MAFSETDLSQTDKDIISSFASKNFSNFRKADLAHDEAY
jgi:hypothetical protein